MRAIANVFLRSGIEWFFLKKPSIHSEGTFATLKCFRIILQVPIGIADMVKGICKSPRIIKVRRFKRTQLLSNGNHLHVIVERLLVFTFGSINETKAFS